MMIEFGDGRKKQIFIIKLYKKLFFSFVPKFSFVENFYIFDKTSIVLLLENIGKDIIIHKKTIRGENKKFFFKLNYKSERNEENGVKIL